MNEDNIRWDYLTTIPKNGRAFKGTDGRETPFIKILIEQGLIELIDATDETIASIEHESSKHFNHHMLIIKTTQLYQELLILSKF